MGTHSARRPRAMSGLAGRGLFTATAAVALVGGSAGMAFAGEAPSHGEGSQGHSQGHQHGHDQQDCEIPVVDQSTQTVGHVLNGATGGATGPVLDAGDRALAPVHSAVCSPAHDILGQLPGLSRQDAGQDEEGTEQASPEGSSQEGSEESTADESTAGQTPDVDSAAASDEGGATQGVAAPGATSTTDLPVEVPAAS